MYMYYLYCLLNDNSKALKMFDLQPGVQTKPRLSGHTLNAFTFSYGLKILFIINNFKP